jgi:hypothetical protein
MGYQDCQHSFEQWNGLLSYQALEEISLHANWPQTETTFFGNWPKLDHRIGFNSEEQDHSRFLIWIAERESASQDTFLS